MAISPLDSQLFGDLFGDRDIARLLSDNAEVRAMMIVEGALAKVQGDHGVIPAESAAAIHRASLELQIDPAGLAAATGKNAVSVPGLVAAFRDAMNAPEHAQYLHWGATSQDIIDTALVLRLRQMIEIYEIRLLDLIATLGDLAKEHADLPMAARTYGQVASPTSFGALVANWGNPLLRHHARLQEIKPRLLQVSLSGAAGTLSVMGAAGAKLRADLAKTLGLGDQNESWHSTRDTLAEFSSWATLVTASIAKMGEDLILLTQTGINEVTLSISGGSSTMPQKSNPVLPTVLVSLAQFTTGLNSTMQLAVVHRQQRDGVAWFTEWLALPQICMTTARSLSAANEIVGSLAPDSQQMETGLDDGTGMIYAEALSFAASEFMPRPAAQAKVKELCQTAAKTQAHLSKLAEQEWPEMDLTRVFDANVQMGLASAEARTFAKKAAKLQK